MITKEHIDFCFDEPTFVGVVYQQFYRIGDNTWPAGNEQLMSKAAGRDVVDQIVALESELFVVTPVFTGKPALALPPIDEEQDVVTFSVDDVHYKMLSEMWWELFSHLEEVGAKVTHNSLVATARIANKRFVLYKNCVYIV